MNKTQRVQDLLARPIEWDVPLEAVQMIATEEDCALTAYRCSAGVPTCGWGETAGVRMGMVWTQDYADERLRQSLSEWGSSVRGMLTEYADDGQLAGMLSLAYNIGLQAFRGSTVLKQHNAGNMAAAARAFGLWNKVKVGGKLVENDGLTARRAREAAAYLSGEPDGKYARLPQAVMGESSLSKSPIARGGVVTAGTGATALVGGIADKFDVGMLASVHSGLQQVGDVVSTATGLPPLALVGAVLVGSGYFIVKWRREQRTQGWA